MKTLDKTVPMRILSGMGNILSRKPPVSQFTASAGGVFVYSGESWKSRLINWITFGPSHVSMVVQVDSKHLPLIRKLPPFNGVWVDRLLVVESTSLSDEPCVIFGEKIAGVQAHEIDSILKYSGRVWYLPLLEPLSVGESDRLTELAMSQIGREYDTIGAGLCATRWLKKLMWWRTVQRNTLECVEIVGADLMEVLRFRLKGVRWNSGALTPRQFVKVLYETGLYGELERVK